MAVQVDPYDELRYPTYPIEHSAPERLALASLLHGGPRAPLEGYRVLEIGCGDGGNLLPLAWFRRHASVWGLDGAATQIARAEQRVARLGLTNVTLVHAELRRAHEHLDPDLTFDFILAHGVLSWVPDPARDAMLQLCARHLAPHGLLYLNYNTQPGWSLRGLVRDFLLAQTADLGDLRARAEAAQAVGARLAAALDDDDEHPYRRLMANELRLVRDGHVAYVAHEYLAPVNRAYWRHEMLERLSSHGLTFVADADFDQPWERGGDDFSRWLRDEGIVGRAVPSTVDLLRYRQLHSPVLTRAPWSVKPLRPEELARLFVASCLQEGPGEESDDPRRFGHPTGYEVTVDDDGVAAGLRRLAGEWPRGLRVGEAFDDVAGVLEDLPLLHRNGMVELRCVEPEPEAEAQATALWQLEAEGGYRTTALHRRVDLTEP